MTDLLEALERGRTAAMLAGLVVLLFWEGAHPFYEYFRARPAERGRHVVRNLVLGGLNAGIVSVVFVGLWGATALWAAGRGVGLLHRLESGAGLPDWAHAVGAVALLDLWTYVWHRLNHRVPFLWRFHRIHHNDPKMDVTTANRFHTGEIVLSSLLRIPLIALVGVYLWELVLYEALMFAVVQLHHANVALPGGLERGLRAAIVTPGMHKVHHSRWRPETDSNYSALFSVWDRIGRTFRVREHLSTLRLGLDGWDGDDDQSFLGILRGPFRTERPPDRVEEAGAEERAAEAEGSAAEPDGWTGGPSRPSA